MLVSQMAPPAASSVLAFCVKLDTSTMPTTSRMAASALASVISPISTLVRLRNQGRSRSMRPGSPMMSATSSTTRTTRNSQAASPLRSCVGQRGPEQARGDDGERHRPPGLALVGPLTVAAGLVPVDTPPSSPTRGAVDGEEGHGIRTDDDAGPGAVLRRGC